MYDVSPFSRPVMFPPLPILLDKLSAVPSGLGNWYRDCQGGGKGEGGYFTGVETVLEGESKEFFGEAFENKNLAQEKRTECQNAKDVTFSFEYYTTG